MGRERDFAKIANGLKPHTYSQDNRWLVCEGDSLEILKNIPAQSISLILTDPPYHSTKKKNIYGDTLFEQDEHYVEWMGQIAQEWARILRPNGSLFCFCAPTMAARLEVKFASLFNILSQIVWTKPNEPGFDGWKQKMKKESLRQWYEHSERIIFAEPANHGNLHRSYFGNLLRKLRIEAGLTTHKLTALTGAYGKVNHGGAVSNWEAGRNIPSRDQYEKLRKAILAAGKIKATDFPAYEDSIRKFTVDGARDFTDVWNFPSVRPYKGKHPAEKPVSLLEHAIEATTYEDDIVLDCFSGSGNTALAAIGLKRYAISIDIEPLWTKRTTDRLKGLRVAPHKNILKNISVDHTKDSVAQASLLEAVDKPY